MGNSTQTVTSITAIVFVANDYLKRFIKLVLRSRVNAKILCNHSHHDIPCVCIMDITVLHTIAHKNINRCLANNVSIS